MMDRWTIVQLQSFSRSYRWVAPYVSFLAMLGIVYAYRGLPVLSSYAVTSVIVYVFAVWLTMLVWTMEQTSERHIVQTHVASKRTYWYGKGAASFLVVCPLIALALVVPLLAGNFRETGPLHWYALASTSHVVLAWCGVVVGTACYGTGLATKKYTALVALGLIVYSLSFDVLIRNVSVRSDHVMGDATSFSSAPLSNGGRIDRLDVLDRRWMVHRLLFRH